MDRLREVISESRIDRHRLSEKSGISAERLAALENGQTPTMSELRSIAQTLGLHVGDFRSPTGREAETELLFRRARIGGSSVDDVVRSKLSRRIADPLSLMTFEASSALRWHGQFNRGPDTAETNAHKFRALFCNNDQLSPLLSLPRIVEEEMGVVLLVIRNSEIDGASGYLDGVPFVLLSARFTPRMLFTLAHEVGHLIAHHNPRSSVAVIDQDVQSSVGRGEEVAFEREANAFASILLMPAQAIGLALKTIRKVRGITDEELGDLEINYLARIFGVSFWAAAIRCEHLGLLPSGGGSALHKELTDRYGSPEKRSDQAGLPPRPEVRFPSVPTSLLRSAVDRIRAGEVSIGRAAEALEMSIPEIMAIHASQNT